MSATVPLSVHVVGTRGVGGGPPVRSLPHSVAQDAVNQPQHALFLHLQTYVAISYNATRQAFPDGNPQTMTH